MALSKRLKGAVVLTPWVTVTANHGGRDTCCDELAKTYALILGVCSESRPRSERCIVSLAMLVRALRSRTP